MKNKGKKVQPVFDMLGYNSFEEFAQIMQGILERVVKTSKSLGKKPDKLRAYVQKYAKDQHFRDVTTQAIHTFMVSAAQHEFFARLSMSLALELTDSDTSAPLTKLAQDISNNFWDRLVKNDSKLAADIILMFYHYLYQHLTAVAMKAMREQKEAQESKITKH